MTTRRLVNLDDFVTEKTTYNRFGEKVTKTPLVRIADGGLLSNYKQLSTNAKYIKFTGMLEPNDGGEGMYIQDDTITDDEDLGVIIYIGEYKYRRLYAAWVNIDWFYIDDFGVALQRAIKYSSIRGTRGKIYECKTAITLKLEQVSSGYATIVDFGHKLVDMRGATVNFTNEEVQYCFNIRIYRNDTKFMFTNCNFNVTSNNINLVNIANIIGVNSYTDMLTDNVYNVTKDKLPDTNRVVLVDEPEIEGIKTFDFNGQLQYIGDAISANDNQAVTKTYKPADYDESLYVSLQDTRKLVGLTTFTSIFDRAQGNTVLQGKINDYILESIYIILQGVVTNNVANVWLPRCYILYNYGTVIKQAYISIDVYKVIQSEFYIIAQQMHIADESEIGNSLFTKLKFSSPIVFTPNIIEEDCITEVNDKSVDNRFLFDTEYISAICIKCTTNIPIVIDGVTHTITTIYLITNLTDISSRANIVMPYTTYSCGIFYINSQAYIIAGINPFSFEYSYGLAKWVGSFPPVSMRYNNKMYTITPVTSIPNNNYPKHRNVEYIKFNGQATTIQDYSEFIETKTTKIRRVTNMPIDILSIDSINKEYIAILPLTWYLTPDTKIDNNGQVSIDSVYIKVVVPVQANLQVFDNKKVTIPTSIVTFTFVFNNNLIKTNQCLIYIPRFISLNIPRFELPPIYANTVSNKGDSVRYPVFHIYANNDILPKKITINPSSAIIDSSLDIASLNRYISCDRPCCGDCRCPCNNRSGDIVVNPSGSIRTSMSVNINGKVLSNTYNYNTYIHGCKASEGTYHSFKFCTGGPQVISVSTQVNIKNKLSIIETAKSWPYITKVDSSTFVIQPGEIVIIYSLLHVPINKVNYRTRNTRVHIKIASDSSACSGGGEPNINDSYNVLQSTSYYLSVFNGINKRKLFDRLFGNKCLRNAPILRDGVLTDPFRNRTQRAEHQFAPPICPLNP